MIGSKNTGCFFVSKFINHFLYVVPVTHKLHKLKIVPMTKIVVLISVQQKWTMSFICLGWHKNANMLPYSQILFLKSYNFAVFLQNFQIIFSYYQHYWGYFALTPGLKARWIAFLMYKDQNEVNWVPQISVPEIPDRTISACWCKIAFEVLM